MCEPTRNSGSRRNVVNITEKIAATSPLLRTPLKVSRPHVNKVFPRETLNISTTKLVH